MFKALASSLSVRGGKHAPLSATLLLLPSSSPKTQKKNYAPLPPKSLPLTTFRPLFLSPHATRRPKRAPSSLLVSCVCLPPLFSFSVRGSLKTCKQKSTHTHKRDAGGRRQSAPRCHDELKGQGGGSMMIKRLRKEREEENTRRGQPNQIKAPLPPIHHPHSPIPHRHRPRLCQKWYVLCSPSGVGVHLPSPPPPAPHPQPP